MAALIVRSSLTTSQLAPIRKPNYVSEGQVDLKSPQRAFDPGAGPPHAVPKLCQNPLIGVLGDLF